MFYVIILLLVIKYVFENIYGLIYYDIMYFIENDSLVWIELDQGILKL